MYRAAAITLTLSVAFVVTVACSPATSGAPGISCTSDTQCGSGLECLADSVPATGGGCTSVGMECLQPCGDSNNLCDSVLGVGYVCSLGPCGASIATCQPALQTSDGGAVVDASPSRDADAASDGARD
jgi:hypothetical protein